MSTQASLLTQDYLAASRESCNELVAGYEGSLDDWEEYLALGEEYLPAFFQQSAISHKNGQTKIRLKDFQVDFKQTEITGDSGLRLHLGYANDQLLAEDLVMFSLSPEKGSLSSYSIQPYYEPSPFSPDVSIETWKESVSGTGDFSGKKIAQGNRVVVRKTALQTAKTIIDPHDQKVEKIFTVGCTYKSSAAEDVEQDCERFFKSVEFTGK